MPKVKRGDLWLERSRNISQIILVGLALFGYFYTVRPIYRNQLLSEELSRKTIELSEKETAISKLDDTRINLERENAKLQKKNENIATEIQIYMRKSVQLKTNIMDLLLNHVEVSMSLQIYEYQLWKKGDKRFKSYFSAKESIEKIDSSYIKQQSKAFQYLRILHEDDQKEIINFINFYIDKNKTWLDTEIDRLYNLESSIIIFAQRDVTNFGTANSITTYLFPSRSQIRSLHETKDDNKEKVSINPLHEIFEKIRNEYKKVNKK